MQTLPELLEEIHACDAARAWVKKTKSAKEAYQTCERGDWLLWIFGTMVGKKGWPSRKQVVGAACDCAQLALKYVAKGEDRPRVAPPPTQLKSNAPIWCD